MKVAVGRVSFSFSNGNQSQPRTKVKTAVVSLICCVKSCSSQGKLQGRFEWPTGFGGASLTAKGDDLNDVKVDRPGKPWKR